jgi:hypothetical protein
LIGDYAFSGSATYDYWKYNGSWSYAYELVMIDGNLSASGYITSYFAPAFEKVELTNAQDIPKTETSLSMRDRGGRTIFTVTARNMAMTAVNTWARSSTENVTARVRYITPRDTIAKATQVGL